MLDLFSRPGPFLRGNLHAHTTESDGHCAPVELARRYREAGYDFLAITDHHKRTEVSDLAVDGLTLIHGQECHPRANRLGEAHHIVALGVERPIESTRGEGAQATIDEIRAAGGIAVLAHPWWHGITAPEMLELTGWTAMEVYNSTCEVTLSRGDSSPIWDELLAAGHRCPALAVDDCHGAVLDAFGGWILLKAEDRSPEAVLAAVARGDFYATCGPEILGLTRDGDRLTVRTTPARIVSLTSVGAKGSYRAAPAGETLEEVTLTIPPGVPYWRLVVTDDRGRRAYGNPVYCDR